MISLKKAILSGQNISLAPNSSVNQTQKAYSNPRMYLLSLSFTADEASLAFKTDEAHMEATDANIMNRDIIANT